MPVAILAGEMEVRDACCCKCGEDDFRVFLVETWSLTIKGNSSYLFRLSQLFILMVKMCDSDFDTFFETGQIFAAWTHSAMTQEKQKHMCQETVVFATSGEHKCETGKPEAFSTSFSRNSLQPL
jgi:hypothetical protein